MNIEENKKVPPCTQLSNWFASQCDGEFEHAYGIRIESTDNPGWLIRFDADAPEEIPLSGKNGRVEWEFFAGELIGHIEGADGLGELLSTMTGLIAEHTKITAAEKSTAQKYMSQNSAAIIFLNREIRKVPANWQHPQDERGNPIPLFKTFNYTKEEIEEGLRDGWLTNTPPNYGCDVMPEWAEEEKTHIQFYETVTEGTPLSPVMDTPENLARWLSENDTASTYEEWLSTCLALFGTKQGQRH